MVVFMDLYLIVGVMIAAYIGAAIVVLINKKNLDDALTGGTIGWIIVILSSFLIPYDAIMALILGFALGAIAQMMLQMKTEFSEALEGKKK